MERRIKKVSYDGKSVLVRWEVPKLHGVDEHELKCHDTPANGFGLALNALRQHVAEICELSPMYCENLQVRGATWSYGGDAGVMGATITALKPVQTANAPLVLNTPHLASEPYTEDGDAEHLLSPEAVDALTRLGEAAFRYVDGQRQQGDLFAPDGLAPPAEAALEDLQRQMDSAMAVAD